MTVTINGTSGITTPGVNSTGSNVLGDNVSDTLNVGNGAIVTDSSGNVGIGTSSPAYSIDVTRTSGSSALQLLTSGSGGQTAIIESTRSGALNISSESSIGAIAFKTGTSGTSERMRIDSSGNLLFNSGYGSVATAYGCRAWVNFNGTGTVAIRASGNVSSITDNGTGTYTINFTNAMPDVNYSCVVTSNGNGAAGVGASMIAGSVQVITRNSGAANTDYSIVNVEIAR